MASVIGIGVGLLGAGTSAVGSAKSAAKEKRIANFDSKVAQAQAQDALDRGREAEDTLRMGVKKLLGTQRAAFAGQGVTLDSGSALEVQQDTGAMEARDLSRIKLNAAREAWGYEMESTNYALGGQAKFNQDMAQGYGTILGGLGNAFTQYGQVSAYKKSQAKSDQKTGS